MEEFSVNNINCAYCPLNGNGCKIGIDDNYQCYKLQLYKESVEMQNYLEITASDNPDELIQRLSDLNVYMARSGNMLAVAKKWQDKTMASIFDKEQQRISHMPSTIANKFIVANCDDINYLATMLDRINRTATHQSENIRTQISFMKEDLKLQKTGTGV